MRAASCSDETLFPRGIYLDEPSFFGQVTLAVVALAN